MPFAGFADFDACLAHMTKPKSEGGGGYDEETARKVCGKLQAQAKESFSWVGDIKLVPGVQNLIRGEALHPIKTVHPEEWPSVRVYLEEELEKAAHTLAGKPLLLDHSMLINGEVTGAQYEDGAIEYVARVNDPRILGLIKDETIKHCSVEFEWKSLEQVNGVAPRGLNFTGLSLLKNFAPGDPLSTVELVEVWEGIVKQLKEAKGNTTNIPKHVRSKEQAEPQEFILYTLRDPQAFMPEHFSTSWIDQTNGVQGIFGRLREDPENPVPQALLFMKVNNWTLEKMQEWLENHPQYLRGPAPAQPGIQPAGGVTGAVMKMSKEKRPKTLEGRVTFLETRDQLREQELSKEEIEAKINDLTKQRQALENELQQIAEEEQPKRDEIWQQIDLINAELQAYEQALAALVAGLTQPAGSAGEGKAKEAEWDTEYINDLPDSAFAVIASGGEKDEQGKTVPRTLRKLPYKNAQGNIDLPHLRNALARLNQIEPASLRPAAKKKLCAAARSEKAEDLVSEFCGEEPETATEQQGEEPTLELPTPEMTEELCNQLGGTWDPETNTCELPLAETRLKLRKMKEQEEPEKDEHGCVIGKERYDEEQGKCVPIEGSEGKKKGLGEAIIESGAPSEPTDLISKKEVLALIPERRIWRSWSLGPQRLVQQLKHKLESQSSQHDRD